MVETLAIGMKRLLGVPSCATIEALLYRPKAYIVGHSMGVCSTYRLWPGDYRTMSDRSVHGNAIRSILRCAHSDDIARVLIAIAKL